jgi:chromosome segregation ATPase
MDAKQRIEVAKVSLQKAKTAQTIAQTQKEAAERQQGEVTVKLAELNVTPETAQAEIAALESQIDAELTKVEGLIPNV